LSLAPATSGSSCCTCQTSARAYRMSPRRRSASHAGEHAQLRGRSRTWTAALEHTRARTRRAARRMPCLSSAALCPPHLKPAGQSRQHRRTLPASPPEPQTARPTPSNPDDDPTRGSDFGTFVTISDPAPRVGTRPNCDPRRECACERSERDAGSESLGDGQSLGGPGVLGPLGLRAGFAMGGFGGGYFGLDPTWWSTSQVRRARKVRLAMRVSGLTVGDSFYGTRDATSARTGERGLASTTHAGSIGDGAIARQWSDGVGTPTPSRRQPGASGSGGKASMAVPTATDAQHEARPQCLTALPCLR